MFDPSISQSPSIGLGKVRIPKYLFKLVYDKDKNQAWAQWQENSNSEVASRPISYAELAKRTGIQFLPTVAPLHDWVG